MFLEKDPDVLEYKNSDTWYDKGKYIGSDDAWHSKAIVHVFVEPDGQRIARAKINGHWKAWHYDGILGKAKKEKPLPILDKKYKNYNWYHLSQNDLGASFTFIPRIPKHPMNANGGMIEDDFSVRTSWAPDIKSALDALYGAIGEDKVLYVYATNKLPGEVDVEKNFDDAPSSPGNEYGEDFDVNKFVRWGKEEGLSQELLEPPEGAEAIRALKGQVPDSPKTHEHWATEPVKAIKIGMLKFDRGKPYVENRSQHDVGRHILNDTYLL